jgi:bacterioferritin
MSDQKVIDLLTKAYVDEVETISNYLAHGVRLDTFDGHDVAEELLADVSEEQQHAQMLGERLKVLKEVPPTSLDDDMEFTQQDLNGIDDTTDVLSVIDGVISAERDACDTYRKLVKAARDVDDYGTASLAEDLLRDEEEHLEEFLSIRKEFDE